MKLKNTLDKGSVRTMIFKEGKTWFGVALEFNIVESGTDPQEIMIMLDEAIRGYVQSARKAKLRPGVLNQVSEPEYENLWSKLDSGRPIPSPIKVHSFGSRSLAIV